MIWIYDIPTWLFGVLTVSASIAVSLLGLFLTYNLVHKRASAWHDLIDNEVVGGFLSQILTLYGITLGLIAVATWESAAQVSGFASQEAASITALYRDLAGYPTVTREDLRGRIRNYTEVVVDKEWPEQQQGIVPDHGTRILTEFQYKLYDFEPTTEGQKIIHAETLRAFNNVVMARRQRVEAVSSGIPGILWAVVLLGAALSILSSYCFQIHDLRIHVVLTSSLAAMIGLLIFLIASLDHPFLGEVSVPPDSYKLLLEKVMPIAQVR